MSLGGHLRELRTRLMWSAAFVLLGSVAGWFLFDEVFDFLQQPVEEIARERGMTAVVNFATIAAAFDLRIQVSIFLGVLLASPVWLYQLWAFITPGLKKRERRFALAFMLSGLPLFLAGTWLAWVSLPEFVLILTSFTPSGSSNVISASDYVLFAIRVLLIFGLAFVMPVVLVLLNFAGILAASSILKSWRLAIFVIAVVSAIATPAAEPMSMFLLMLPLTLLYFVAVGITQLRDRAQSKKLARLEAESEAAAN
jgi:sec-independent protein translocase protein TatC